MPSLFELLLKTMPFAGVAADEEWSGKGFSELLVDEARRHFTLLREKSGIYVELPDVDPNMDRDRQPLWAFSYSTSRPAEVGSVYCRVHDADNVGHHVADRIAWGLEDAGGLHSPEIAVTFKAGAEVRLPLTSDYLLWAFRVVGGAIPEDHSTLWRLESNLDTSIVAVFLYDIDPVTGQVTKTDFEKVQDPQLRDDLREVDRAVKEIGFIDDSPADPPKQEEKPAHLKAVEGDVWGGRVLRGANFWPNHPEGGAGGAAPPAGVGGVVGNTVQVLTEPARIMVVFSFTTCCERADFEPGGMVGFARCYPHLLVSGTVPIEKISASAHIDRPSSMSKWHEEDRDMSANCCKPPYDGWTEQIGSLLVTDANDDADWFSPVPLPFWSNMFHYYLNDPFLKSGGQQRYHIIRNDRPSKRESAVPLVSRTCVAALVPDLVPALGFDIRGIVKKEPRQGMFDNVHLAPRLRLMNVTSVANPYPQEFEALKVDAPIEDRGKWGFDEIVMAPFCAHDCLHLHWRWGLTATKKWSLGWDSVGPYRAAGAPMVPLGQDVWLRFRGRTCITYDVEAWNPEPYDGWCVLMHHGFGYAVSILDRMKTVMAMLGVTAVSGVQLLSRSGAIVTPLESTAAYYWTARFGYVFDRGRATPFERLSSLSEDKLKEAIDL